MSEAVSHALHEQLAEEYKTKLEVDRAAITAEAEKLAENKIGDTLSQLKSRSDDQEQKLKESRERELLLLKEKEGLQEARDTLELEVARAIDNERQMIVTKTLEQASEAERLRLLEKEQKISSMQKKINDLQQTAGQGSMQLSALAYG